MVGPTAILHDLKCTALLLLFIYLFIYTYTCIDEQVPKLLQATKLKFALNLDAAMKLINCYKDAASCGTSLSWVPWYWYIIISRG